jgi:hypothetical protein
MAESMAKLIRPQTIPLIPLLRLPKNRLNPNLDAPAAGLPLPLGLIPPIAHEAAHKHSRLVHPATAANLAPSIPTHCEIPQHEQRLPELANREQPRPVQHKKPVKLQY